MAMFGGGTALVSVKDGGGAAAFGCALTGLGGVGTPAFIVGDVIFNGEASAICAAGAVGDASLSAIVAFTSSAIPIR
jgi:hypothetical protein